MNTEEHRRIQDKIIEALCSQALSDHLGDVRDAEEKLWEIIGVPRLPWNDPIWDKEYSAYRITKARLNAAGLDVPAYLQNDDE